MQFEYLPSMYVPRNAIKFGVKEFNRKTTKKRFFFLKKKKKTKKTGVLDVFIHVKHEYMSLEYEFEIDEQEKSSLFQHPSSFVKRAPAKGERLCYPENTVN